MSLTNPLGDAELSDPQAMRALAHPVRLAALSYLQRNGPATATMLSAHVGATPSVTSWHLRHLAGFGLVLDADPDEVPGDKRHRWWKAAARGIRFETTGSPEARALGEQLFHMARGQIDTWLSDMEPALTPQWRDTSRVSNTGVRLTPGEVRELNEAIDELLGKYVLRDDIPGEARRVRVLRFFLPETGE